jgi:hypothetical protein
MTDSVISFRQRPYLSSVTTNVVPQEEEAWSPADFGANLVAWYKYDAGLYSDAGTTPVSDGGTVQQWNDQSGNSYHLTQPTSGARPVYDATGSDSKPTLVFTTADVTSMFTAEDSVTAFGTTTSFSVFVLGRMNGFTANNGGIVCYEYTGTQDWNDQRSWVMSRTGTTNEVSVTRNNVVDTQVSITLNTNLRLGVVYNGSTGTMYLDNTPDASPGANTNALDQPGTLAIGGQLVGLTSMAAFFQGEIREVIITKHAASAGDRTNVDTYFSAR